MQLDIIDSFAAFEALEANWKAVYAADPEAHYFLSWGWMRQLFSDEGNNWCVLAARHSTDDSDHVAFFPLLRRVRFSKSRQRFCSEIQMAGSISWADYTGFICHPDHETAAAAFGAHLRSMGWRRLTLKNFRAPAKRLASFISALEGPDLHHDERQRIVKTDNTNLLVCPYVSLPEDFDRYLQDRISANTRQKIRRFLRKIDQSDELRFTEADSRTFERDIEILVAFWRSKWARRKGDRVDELASKYRSILHQARADDALFLPVLWRGSEPLGALASFVDREKKTLMFFVAGRDESCNDPPPGLVLHAHSIRWAIANGLHTYDLLRGDEHYKYSFGATDRHIKYIIVSTLDPAREQDPSDSRSIAAMVRQSARYHEAGRTDEAESGYRQVLALVPDHPAALRHLGRLLVQTDRYAEAEPVFERLASASPGA
ncbi:MAG: GNAT family N-acetyltransferase [Rhodocyclaceae bacterium]|nr:GNAT family N-acetyltransferase [Rhodocyclaceae bacterium]MCP5231222.1 GNAT family N-acetyltransferase [Zoogloeaceae bacterium]MCP5241419.1 GNAT family N-acetyltransferase [Zoogloeaceae bacterium]MCW5614016.1 GNAT family N-acetyltransferase [Rhodocyclaceae bacterium]